MGKDVIREFLDKQLTPFEIGTPKPRDPNQPDIRPKAIPAQSMLQPVTKPKQPVNAKEPKRRGRPKLEDAKKRTTVFLRQSQLDRIKMMQYYQKMSMNEVISHAVDEYIDNHTTKA